MKSSYYFVTNVGSKCVNRHPFVVWWELLRGVCIYCVIKSLYHALKEIQVVK